MTMCKVLLGGHTRGQECNSETVEHFVTNEDTGDSLRARFEV